MYVQNNSLLASSALKRSRRKERRRRAAAGAATSTTIATPPVQFSSVVHPPCNLVLTFPQLSRIPLLYILLFWKLDGQMR